MVEPADREIGGRLGAVPREGGAGADVSVGVDADAWHTGFGVQLDEPEHGARSRGEANSVSFPGTRAIAEKFSRYAM